MKSSWYCGPRMPFFPQSPRPLMVLEKIPPTLMHIIPNPDWTPVLIPYPPDV